MTTKYTERIVAFVDILGFSQLVNSALPGPSCDKFLAHLEDILQKSVQKYWEQDARDESTMRMFSDSICVSASPTLGGFLTTLGKLANVQQSLLRQDLLLRGAVTIGLHYESPTLIFSKGIVRAYGQEKSVALFPRIIVDAVLIKRFLNPIRDKKKRRFLGNPFLLRDSDGQFFVNYISSMRGEYLDGLRRKNLRQQRELILKLRRKFRTEAAIMMKLSWLERYHNYVVQTMDPALDSLYVGAPKTQGFEKVFPQDIA